MEGEIGDKRHAPLGEERGRSQVAGQQAVRPQTQQRLDRFHFAGFLHPRRGQKDGGPGGPGLGNRLRGLVRVGKIDDDFRGPGDDGRPHLLQPATKDDPSRRRAWGGQSHPVGA